MPPEWELCGWVYNTYIQLVYHTENPTDMFLDFSQQQFWEDFNVFIKGYLRFPANTEQERKEIMRVLEEYINHGFYVYGEWNEFHIPGMPFYRKDFFRHYFFVYGYDSENIYSEGYREDAHWHRFKVNKDLFIDSLLSDQKRDGINCIGMNVYRPDQTRQLYFDYEKVIHDCKEYLDGLGPNKQLYYGLGAVKKFFDHVLSSIRQGGDFPIQSVYIIYEHKIMMEKRMQYMNKVGFGHITELELESYHGIVKTFYSIVCTCVKYKISMNPDLATKMELKMEWIYHEEEKILRRCFNV